MQVVKTLNERISGYCQVTLETMAYSGTGDVLKIQKMLAIVGEHIEVEEGESWKVAHQSLKCRKVQTLASSQLHIGEPLRMGRLSA